MVEIEKPVNHYIR
jgi:hypothetical protein